MSDFCKVCDNALNESQYSSDVNYKSCPSCSKANGEEHVYYAYPDAFGTTQKRSSTSRPEGPQSYCARCRGRGDSYPEQILCSQIHK